MTDIQLFNFGTNQEHPLRVVTIDGNPWFVFNDVCAAIEIAAPHRAATRLDSEDLRTAQVLSPQGTVQGTTVVSESGLYDLIFVSRKLAAKQFKKWITSEVIPSIRKTGMYVSEMDLPRALRQYADAVEAKQRAEALAVAAQAYIEENQPAIEEHAVYMSKGGTCSLGALGQALGGGRQRLIDRLRELKILVSKEASQGGTRPMQQYAEADGGWFIVRPDSTPIGPVMTAYATPKGVSGVYRRLKQYGVGERPWKGWPDTEQDLFDKISFEK